MKLYIGTYTDLGGPGIWSGELENDAFNCLGALRDADNPNYLIKCDKKRALFAVAGSGNRGYCALSYDLSTGAPRLSSKQELSGRDPCHLVLSPDGRFLITANYADGSLSVFPVDGNKILPQSQFIRHEGKSVNPARQEGPHTHHVSFAPGEHGLLHAVDLGLDKLMEYRFDAPSGHLTFERAFDIPRGSGPRHLTYAAGGEHIYICNELSSEVTFIERGTVHPGVSTLPAGYEGESFTAAIRISPDENALFVSNRGHDSIAEFSLEGGMPSLSRHIPSGGQFPRDFVLLPGDKLLVANQNGGGVVLLDKTGTVIARANIPGAVSIAL